MMPAATTLSLSGSEQTAEDAARQEALQHRGELPGHIALIMDGNGRWAEAQGRSRVTGHNEGVVSVRDITEACAQLGIGHLTLYTFSTENWDRPAGEVNALMKLLIHTLRKEKRRLKKNNVRLQAFGDTERLPTAGRNELADAVEETAANSGLTLNLALSYSGRWDIVRAVRRLAQAAREGALLPAEIDESRISESLTTKGAPDPDLLIRTRGEERISNFLLWEIAYTEIYFTDLFWPAFRREQLYDAIEDYQDRDRRFGRVSP